MTNLDRIIASVPLDQTAARVTSQSGEHYEPKVEYSTHRHWETPPSVKTIAGLAEPIRSLASELIGRKFGRFVVIGLWGDPDGLRGKNAPLAWVVGCTCGHYETRTAKAIRNPMNANDMCQNCRHLEKIKWKYINLGSRTVEEFADPAGLHNRDGGNTSAEPSATKIEPPFNPAFALAMLKVSTAQR